MSRTIRKLCKSLLGNIITAHVVCLASPTRPTSIALITPPKTSIAFRERRAIDSQRLNLFGLHSLLACQKVSCEIRKLFQRPPGNIATMTISPLAALTRPASNALTPASKTGIASREGREIDILKNGQFLRLDLRTSNNGSLCTGSRSFVWDSRLFHRLRPLGRVDLIRVSLAIIEDLLQVKLGLLVLGSC